MTDQQEFSDRTRRAIFARLAVALVLLPGCGGGGGGAGNAGSPIVPVVAPTTGTVITTGPGSTPTPAPNATLKPGTTPTPSVTFNPGTTPSPFPTVAASARSFLFKLFIPTTGTARSTAAALRATEETPQPTFISSATQSIGITVGADPQQVIGIGLGAPDCEMVNGIRSCDINIPLPGFGNPTIRLALYASADGTGDPISATSFSAPPVGAPSQTSTVTFKPVIATLNAVLSGQFAAGDPSLATVTVAARTSLNDVVDLTKETPVDESGNPVIIALTDSDTSGKTSLSTTTYPGVPVSISYNGDLPLPAVSINVSAKAGGTVLATTSVANTTPKASHSYSFALGSPTLTPNSGGMTAADFYYIPDGRFNTIKNSDSTYTFYWGINQASTGSGPLPENQTANAHPIFNHSQVWEQAGAWFLSVYPQNTPYTGSDSKNLIALYHAESAYTGYYDKTMAVTYSHDGGQSWATGQQIITPTGYPVVKAAQHSADSCVVWDPAKNRWVAFYAGDSITQAVSYDKNASPGTWKKYYQGAYTEPGLGGKETINPAFTSRYFSSPSVSWNSYLNEWVMTMDGHIGIWISTSEDLDTWTVPRLVTDGSDIGPSDEIAYSTMIGANGEKVTQRTSRMYYARFVPNSGRKLYGRSITFTRND